MPPVGQRGEVIEELLEPWGYLFNRPNQRGATRFPLSVRRSALRLGGRSVPPPLFSGECEFSRYVGRDLQAQRTAWLSLNFWLNPTRYVRHQCAVPLPSRAPDATWPEARLFANKAAPAACGEIVLNNNDNWIPQSPRHEAFANPIRWARHLEIYLTAVPGRFEQELTRAQQNVHGVEFERDEQTLNLQVAESYWEFSSENPTALVTSLVPLFQSFSARYRETSHFRQDFDSSIDRNALSLYAEINSGRAIRIYAKTNRRIRVEVIHNFGGRFGYQIEGGHTLEAWSALPDLLRDLAEDAATLVNRLFEYFRQRNEIAVSHVTPYELLLEILHGSRDLPTAITITTLLVGVGSIAAEGNETRVQRALQRLSQAGVIEYDRQASNYTVTALHRYALETLRRNGNCSPLVARRRTR